ncbi:hypothetical protein llap_5595 [Limosa lapponica baueri]|uniref:Uncharacterized protein n=1 Tax=Limosa lapponica baueri TaxID=1758121 RepID=A0A2I0UDJ3_LIMLA|nr:hypothetical protein llap_5595 [Limosa lapponica baueri]
MLKGPNKVSSKPALLQADQPQLYQPVFIEEVFQPLIIFMALLWTCSSRSMSFLYWGHQSWMQCSRRGLTKAEQRGSHLQQHAGHASFDAAKDMVGFLGTASARCQLMSNFSSTNTPKSFSTGLLSIPSSPLSVPIPVVALTLVHDLVFGLVELVGIRMHELHQPIKVPMDAMLSPKLINCTTQLGVICKLVTSCDSISLNRHVYILPQQSQSPKLPEESILNKKHN